MSQRQATLAPESGHEPFWALWNMLQSERGMRAALRRAASVGEIVAQPAVVRLFDALGQSRVIRDSSSHALQQTALAAALVARVRDATRGRHLGAALGAGDPPALSEMRLQRLLAAEDVDELLTLMRRALERVERVDVRDVGITVMRMTDLDEIVRRDARTQLALRYYKF